MGDVSVLTLKEHYFRGIFSTRQDGDGSNKPVPFPRDGPDKSRVFRVVFENYPDFGDGRIDAVVDVEKNVFAP